MKILLQKGLSFHRQGMILEAKRCYDAILKEQPRHFDALNLLATLAAQTGNYQMAIDLFDKAIAVKPGIAESHNNRGNVLQELRRFDESLESYDKALRLRPDYAEVYNNKGRTLLYKQQVNEALDCFDKALALNNEFFEAYNNRGNALMTLRQWDAALVSYDRALAINPNYAEAYNNKGNALKELIHLDAALSCYDKALQIKPHYAAAYNNKGNVQVELRQWDVALSSFDHALKINPAFAEACYNRGNVLVELKRLDEALSSYERALELDPGSTPYWEMLFYTQVKVCEWSGLASHLGQIKALIESSGNITKPFFISVILDDLELLGKAARIYSASRYPAVSGLGEIEKRISGDKIRIGYYSADFYNHATAYLMAELFELHDKDRFEVHGFSFGTHVQDEMYQRVSSAFFAFHDVSAMNDQEVAKFSRETGIDIAIDLKGYTKYSRPGIFAERCAPIQANYLGYPGTMGATFMDYIIADKTVIPEESQQYYTEKVVYLPNSYQVNDSKRKISDAVFSRKDAGLPDSGFVFCCFNNNYKILPPVFEVWMRLLKSAEGSVLWLLEDNPVAVRNLRKAAESTGVDADRLVFAGRLPLAEHLARHRLADLFIDTLPCNAHTTASDALWAGLPVLTCAGHSFASRVAASLLCALGLSEMVTSSLQEYEALALQLVRNGDRLTAIRERLAGNRQGMPLFNTGLFVRHIELAYMMMCARYQAGLEPECIVIN